MNRWILTEDIKRKWKPYIKEFIDKMSALTIEDVENMSNDEFTIELSDTELRPYTLLELMKEFGYDNADFDDNGWELDYWITIEKSDKAIPSGCEVLCIHGCGMTFELNLSVKQFM
ncbi:hypothetical protein [Anaerovorax sp. IOR16]|uniref:hypothetical protein n=1 Tax=Anaerovorax sp. IOR16 TaxID=2773458 RepID=UPI0019D065C3|nr:hypothetical protein [Anaerovorax sp. IOR16]